MKSATIYLSGSCNLRCKHCSVGLDHHAPREQLSTADAKMVIANLCASDVKVITLLGGEITYSRSDLRELLAFGDDHGAMFSLNTNLSDPSQIEDALDLPALGVIVVSLDGITAKTHDAIRGKGQFERTLSNLKRLAQQPRVVSKEVGLHLTFVINRKNFHEAADAIGFARDIGAHKINFNIINITGRARLFNASIDLAPEEAVDTTAEVMIRWMLERGIELEFYIPPAVGDYLNRLYGLSRRISNWSACGGPVDSYGYVDLYGNHLPCPSMAVEENGRSQLRERKANLDIVQKPAADIWQTSLFKGFELSRQKHRRTSQIQPCRWCAHRETCSPCTAGAIKQNADANVPLCKALFETLAVRDKGLLAELFPFAPSA